MISYLSALSLSLSLSLYLFLSVAVVSAMQQSNLSKQELKAPLESEL
jgi:hypothetical protein